MKEQKPKKHAESAEISTLRERIGRRRPIRLSFTRHLSERYGMVMGTASYKILHARYHRWEVVGIDGCIAAYLPEYEGEPEGFYRNIPSKADFRRFMADEMGMCSSVADRRFTDFDFSELERKGLRKAYEDFILELSGKEDGR